MQGLWLHFLTSREGIETHIPGCSHSFKLYEYKTLRGLKRGVNKILILPHIQNQYLKEDIIGYEVVQWWGYNSENSKIVYKEYKCK